MRRRFAYENQNSCQWFAASIRKAPLWRCNANSVVVVVVVVVGHGLVSSCLVVGFSFAQGHRKAHLQIPWNLSSLSQQQQQQRWQEIFSHKLKKNFGHNLQHSKQARVPILSWGVLAKQHPTPAIKQQQATSTDLRAGEFLDNDLGLRNPMMLLLITSQSVGWMDRGYGLIIFKHVQGTRVGCNSLVTLHCMLLLPMENFSNGSSSSLLMWCVREPEPLNLILQAS